MDKLEDGDIKRVENPRTTDLKKPTQNPTASSRGQILLNVNDLPLPSPADEETAILQSAVLIEDGIHHRSIHHKIDPTSLKIYRIYHSRYVQWLLGFVVFINLLLAFFEYPTSMSVTSDFRFRDIAWHLPQPACGVTETIEVICLLVFLADCVTRFKLLGWRRFIVQPCLVIYASAIVISFLDLIVSLSFCHVREREFPYSLGYSLRIRRFFRPLFFVLLSRVMRKMTKAIALTFPRILTVITLLVIHLYVFAMIGLLVFPRPKSIASGTEIPGVVPPMISDLDFYNSSDAENYTLFSEFYTTPNISVKNASSNLSTSPLDSLSYYQLEGGLKYFNTVFDAFISLIVLTTASHPDVMVPIYQYNRFSAIYFIFFLGIGAYIILNLLIAATYYQFKRLHQLSLQKRFERRRVAFRAAFTVLARKAQKKRIPKLSNNETVTKGLVRGLLKKARIHKDLVPLMYHHLETMKSAVLNWPQFCALFDMATNRPTPRQRTTQRPYYTRVRMFQWIQYFIRHCYFRYFSYLVNLVSVVMITVELQVAYVDTLSSPNSRLAYYNLIFTAYFTLELILKLLGYGLCGYFRCYSNIYEFVITLSVLLLQIVTLVLYSPFKVREPLPHATSFHILIRLINILILLRLLRVLVQVESLYQLTKFIINLVKNLCGFFGVIVIIYYIFALLGMELFLDIQGPVQDVTKNCMEQQCNTNDNLTYVANDFGDFASSIVTLWDVMVVNNWFIFLENFAQNTMLIWWSKIYFVAWWLVSSIVCINFFTALVVGTFLSNIEEFYKQQERRAQENGKLGESLEWDESLSGSLEESQVVL